MEFEHELQIDKKRDEIRKNTEGPNVASIMLLGVCYMLSFLPFNLMFVKSDLSFSLLIGYVAMIGFSIEIYMTPYLKIIEGGKPVWIFEKYRFAPTCAKRQFAEKRYLLLRFCIKHGLICELVQLISCALFVFADFHDSILPYFNILCLMPVATFLVLGLLKGTDIAYHAYHIKH